MNGLPLDHIGIAVTDLDSAARLYELITGERCSPIEVLESQGAKVAFVGQVELIEPTRPDSAIGRFLERRGSGLHHIAFRTRDLQAELDQLRADGFELIDERPRLGARGHLVAFLHPRATEKVLVELVQITDP